MGLTSKHPPKGGKKEAKLMRVVDDDDGKKEKVASPTDLADGIGRVLHALDVVIDKAIDTEQGIEATFSSEDPSAVAVQKLLGLESIRLCSIVTANLSVARVAIQTAGEVALGLGAKIAERADKLGVSAKRKKRKDGDDS